MSPNPFGEPDGARSPLEDVLDSFVQFDSRSFGSLGLDENRKLRIRLIIGPKGSGKTVYLRRMQVDIMENPSVFKVVKTRHRKRKRTFTPVYESAPPSTTLILKFSRLFSYSLLSEKWSRLWKLAILRSLVSYVLKDETLSKEVEPGQLDQLNQLMKNLRRDPLTGPVPVYGEAQLILAEIHSEDQFERYSNQSDWLDLEVLLARVIDSLPPIYFFLDGLDETYKKAPKFWLSCQIGMFHHIMAYLRDPRWGNRLHVIVCLRDHVLAAVYQDEHQNRYRQDPHILVLNWDYPAIHYFLGQKLDGLDESNLVDPKSRSDSLMKAWLGRDTIFDPVRQRSEDLVQYLLRHTRQLPRDVIQLGNKLDSEVQACKGEGQVPEDEIIRCCRERHSLAPEYRMPLAPGTCPGPLAPNQMTPVSAPELGSFCF